MEQYIIKGGNPLVGEVEIGGAKNAALAILAAAIMTDETVLIDNLPDVNDINVLLEAIQGIGEIEKIAYETEKKLLKEVELFDVYEGKNLEAGKKSYAVSFLLQDEIQTLNDKMIDKIMSKLVKNLEDKLGAKLR